MNVSIAHPGNTASHKVPDCYSPIIAAHCQQSTPPVEGARESLAARVQDTVIVLESEKERTVAGAGYSI